MPHSKVGKAKSDNLRVRETLMVVALAWFVAASGCRGQVTAIEGVLKADAGTSSNAKSISEIVQRMRGIDTSKCPKDFQAAYLAHIHAWERAVQLEQRAIQAQKNHSEGMVFFESFVRGFLGDGLGKLNELNAMKTDFEKEVQRTQSEVQRTFQDVEQVALKHGARLPQSNH